MQFNRWNRSALLSAGAGCLMAMISVTAVAGPGNASHGGPVAQQNKAHAPVLSPEQRERIVKANRKGVERVLYCVRELVQKKRGAEQGLFAATGYLKLAQEQVLNASALDQIAKSCEKVSRQFPASHVYSASEQTAWLRGEGLRFPDSVRKVIEGFATPTVNCGQNHVGAGLGLRAGVFANLGYGVCWSSDGRRWAELNAGVGGGSGGKLHSGAVLAAIDFGYSTYSAAKPYSGNPLRGASYGVLAGGVGVGASTSTQGNWKTFNSAGGEDTGIKGRGVAFGGYWGTLHQGNLEVLPLGTDLSAAFETLTR